MNRQIQSVIVSLGFLLLALFVIDRCVGWGMDRLYFSRSHKKAYALKGVHEELLVMGYSRAENHYIPMILEDSTNLTCFNFGSGGQNIYYQYALLNTILLHHTPRAVLLELGSIDYLKTSSASDKDKLSQLSPLYAHCAAIREVLDSRGIYEPWKFLFRSFAFNSTPSDILYTSLVKGNNPSMKMQGYIPIIGIYNEPLVPEQIEYEELDPEKIACLNRFVRLCKDNKIRLVVAISPAFQIAERKFRPKIIGRLRNCGVPVVDYSGLLAEPQFRSYFKDVLHLNYTGAEYYTPIIGAKLKVILNDIGYEKNEGIDGRRNPS